MRGASPLEVITDASGGYSFVDLPSGDYMVQVTLPAGYFATASNPFTARVRAGTTSQVDMGTVIRVQLPLIRN